MKFSFVWFLVISVGAIDVNSASPPSDVVWPTPDILKEADIFKDSAPSAFVMLPASLIQIRGVSSGEGSFLMLCMIIAILFVYKHASETGKKIKCGINKYDFKNQVYSI